MTLDPGSANTPLMPAADSLALVLALLAGPVVALAVLGTGGSLHLALVLGLTGGWWALWAIPSLPVHFAPLLTLLVSAMFSIEPASKLMLGFGMDAFWWILGSWMLGLAAWETGLIGTLFAPRRGLLSFFCRLLAGLAGLPGTRAYGLLLPFAQQESRAGHAGFHVGKIIGLPGHALNLFALALLPLPSIEQYTLVNWLAMTLPTATLLALLSACLWQPAPLSPQAHGLPPTMPLRARVRLTSGQGLAILAIFLAWLGAAMGTWHGLPSGMWFLYLGLMTVAAGLLPLERFWRDIDWLLLLSLGIGMGLAQTVAATLTPLLIEFFDGEHGAGSAGMMGISGPWRPLVVAFVLMGLTALGFRYLGLVRTALIVLPVALALASALAGEPAGWLLIVLMTLHWLDICAETPGSRPPLVRAAVRLTGLGVIGLTAAVWFNLEVF